MLKLRIVVLLCMSALTLPALAAPSKAPSGGPDMAYLTKILDAWNTLNPENAEKYYATNGDRLFFDVAPLKYNNWGEYKKGVVEVLKGFKTLKLTVNDDAQFHRVGDTVWVAATGKLEDETTTGKHEMSSFRWTVVFQNIGGKWLIVHEHVSEPLQ